MDGVGYGNAIVLSGLCVFGVCVGVVTFDRAQSGFAISYVGHFFLAEQKKWCSRWDLNPNLRLRRPTFYPLNYGNILQEKAVNQPCGT